MRRLTDADAFAKYLRENLDVWKHPEALDWAICKLEHAPPVDAVPVVRCGECEYRRFSEFAGTGNIYCNLKRTYFPLDDFCKFGERRKVDES